MCRGHLLAACIGLLLSWHYHGLSVATEPGFLDFDNLPETNFSCEGKVIGGYYADTETGCQMFHVCTIGQKGPVAGEITDIKFLCLNGTVFDQETRVCERLDEVDCSKSESFYDLNLELYGNQGAEFGIQPENEESQDAELCEEEDEEDCKTEKPLTPVKTFPTEQAHVQDEEVQDEEETTTQQPLTSSTTSRRPVVTSTSFPSTTAAPQVLQFPSSSPETIAALLALHNAFTQSLQQHNTNKDAKINPPKLTGFVESLNPSKSVQQAQTFEIKSPPSPPPPRLPTPFVPKPQSHFNVPHNPSKSQYQSPSKHQFPNQTPTSQYHSPPKTQFPNQPKPQFQNIPKPSPPVRPLSFPKPVQTTSESFGNSPFHHSFHISSQSSHFPDSSYQDQYSDHDSQPSIQPQTEAPKQYDFNDYEDDYYDEKPHSSTITPYLLHQIKVNQVQNANQAKVSSVSHGSFVREVSNPTSSKPFKVPSFRSVTTPGIAVITATSTTSSSSVKTSKPVQSAIQTQKETLTSAGFIDSILHPSNISHHIPDHPQSYDEYIESDVRHDPFYKDVPKIGRSKRSLGNEVFNRHSVTSLNHKTLIKLRDIVLKSVFKNNSETIIKTILQQYCSNQVNPSDSIVSFCSFINLSDYYKNTLFGNDWKIVIPKENNDYIYLVKTISNSNEIQNTTSNILLLVHLPDEFRLLRDSILKILDIEQSELLLTNDTDSNSLLDSSVHHRFKRIRRNKSEDRLDRKLKKYHKKIIVPTKFTSFRTKRQAVLTDGRLNLRENTQRETPQVIQHKEEPNRHGSNQRRVVVNRRRLAKVTLPLDDVEARPLPQERRRPQSIAEVDQRRESVQEKRQPLVLDDGHQTSALPQERRPSSTLSGVDKTRALPQERRRPLQTPVRDSPVRSMNLKSSWDGVGSDSTVEPAQRAKERPTARQRGQGVKYHFSENRQQERIPQSRLGGSEVSEGGEVETATTYPFNLKPGTQFSCDDKIKGGYYADVEAECYGYFICSQGEINGPLLKSHFWCGPTTKFNQRSRTCQTEANVACSVSHRYFHLNKDILSLPDPDDDIKDAFEPSKVRT